jgi:competence protein ComEA
MQRISALSLITILALAGLAAMAAAETGGSPGVVNVNTASAAQLQLLPRIGPALAERIIAFRESNGPFKTPDEMVAVKGIGERSLETLRPYLAVSGETTLSAKVRLPRRRPDADQG